MKLRTSAVRALIAGALALAPTALTGSVKFAAAPFQLPWCCANRLVARGLPVLPVLPGAPLPPAVWKGRRFRSRLPRGRRPQAGESPVKNPAKTAEALILVEGMHCPDCALTIEALLERLPGVRSARMGFTSARAKVSYDPARIDAAALARAIAKAGYPARALESAGLEEPMQARQRAWLAGMAVAGFGALGTMFVAEPLYYSAMAGHDLAFGQVLKYAGMTIATGAGGYTVWPFLKGAAATLKRGTLGMDALVSLGALATYFGSVWGFFTGGAVYFDSLLMFLFLLVIGRFIEASARRRVFSASQRVLGSAAKHANVWRDGAVQSVDIASLQVGDLLEVVPGEALSADGVVVRGRSSMDESMLTGESRPVTRGEGALVTGGTLALDGALCVRLTRVGADTTFAQLARLVDEAAEGKTRLRSLADRIGHWGSWAVLGLAGATYGGWSLVAPAHALSAMVSVLIVTCPCALGLATPFALALALNRGVAQGVLFKRAEALENLARVRHVVLDKTGTLTVGAPVIKHVLGPQAWVLALAAAVESGSEHPLAKAVVRRAEALQLGPFVPPADFVAYPGRGASGSVDGHFVRVGSLAWFEESGLELPPDFSRETVSWGLAGFSILWVSRGEEVIGAIACGDRLRPDAREALARLRERGLGFTLLTGDAPGAALAIARELGISDVRAGMLPDDKLKAIRSLQARYGVVAMVGDGLNDAPALAAADVGLALARGSDLSALAADVVLLGDRFAAVADAFALSQAAMTTAHGGLWLSLAYNLVAIPLAAAGFLTPLWAAVLMPLGSLAVLLNALRLRA